MKKLYVGNLPFSATENDLRNLFSKYPSVTSCSLVTDMETKRSRGFAFVELSSDEEAALAISELNDKPMGARSLVVNEARPRDARPSPRGDSRGERPFNKNRR